MEEYQVTAKFQGFVTITVQANSAEEAREKAADEFGGIHDYPKRLDGYQMIGVRGRNENICVDMEPECWHVDE